MGVLWGRKGSGVIATSPRRGLVKKNDAESGNISGKKVTTFCKVDLKDPCAVFSLLRINMSRGEGGYIGPLK